MKHKTDMLAAVITEFDLKTVGYVGNDESFPEALESRLEKPISGGDPADVVFIDEYGGDPKSAIEAAYKKTNEGGFLMGTGYWHDTIPIQRAVAEVFNLMHVQVGPCNVWCVRR